MEQTKQIESGDDYIDIREIIERVEELEGTYTGIRDPDVEVGGQPESYKTLGDLTREELEVMAKDDGDAEELLRGLKLLDALKGYGGDEQWRGDWYPITLIRESEFENYARQFAEDIGAIADDAKWPCNCIDWKEAAGELQQDYSSVEFEDTTYWYQ